MNKSLWISVVAAAAIIVAVVVVVKQHRQLAQTKEELAAATVAAEKAKEPATAAPTKRRLPESRPATAADESVPVTTPASPAVAAPATGSTNAASNYMASLAGLMKDPQMKQVIRAQQQMALDRMYGALTKYMSLPADKMDGLKQLIADRQMAMTESSMAMMTGTPEERKKAAAETKTVKDDYDKKIKDLLGPTDYETFTQYEQSVGERIQVQMFKDTLPADATLTDQQEYELISAMLEEQKAVPASSLLQNKNLDPSQLTEASIADALKQLEQLQARYAERAGSILTPAQFEKFTKWQQQISAMQTMGLKMAAQMFGNKPAQPPEKGN